MIGLVKINYLETGSMIAYPLNKAIAKAIFKKHIRKMEVLEVFGTAEQWEFRSCLRHLFLDIG